MSYGVNKWPFISLHAPLQNRTTYLIKMSLQNKLLLQDYIGSIGLANKNVNLNNKWKVNKICILESFM